MPSDGEIATFAHHAAKDADMLLSHSVAARHDMGTRCSLATKQHLDQRRVGIVATVAMVMMRIAIGRHDDGARCLVFSLTLTRTRAVHCVARAHMSWAIACSSNIVRVMACSRTSVRSFKGQLEDGCGGH
jgi:hypothetical protein